jgi:hypothetical protein
MKKTTKFDCVEMKRRAQRRIRERLKGATREQEITFYRSGAAQFGQELERARSDSSRKRRQS